MNNLTLLTDSDHWLGWLGDDPTQAVRSEIEGLLRQQVSTAKLGWLRLLEKPYFLTGGRKTVGSPGQMIVTRAALAVPFELEVASAGKSNRLRGVFSWVASGLDEERHDQLYFDLDVEFAWASEQLLARIYGPESPTPEA
ncbi:MAG TPA: hypothetical protein VG122_04350 [Gemmata sp.]|nr:hypothetical protein [Gemmata sp.]